VLVTVSESDPQGQRWLHALLQGLQELGWRRGGNLDVDFRWGDSDNARIRTIAKELIAAKPEVLQVISTPGTAAVLEATRTIPVVFTMVSDPVASAFVESLAHPGGNATGFINIEASMGGKWLELLTEVAPQVKRVTMLFNPATEPQADYYRRSIDAAAASLGIVTRAAPVGNVADIETEIVATGHEANAGLVVLSGIFTLTYRDQIVGLSNRVKLPAVYPFTPFSAAGGLISYGVDLTDLQRRAAVYVDRILHGAEPADLPVQLPTKFELVINLKTAKALGLTVPPSLLARADEVIE